MVDEFDLPDVPVYMVTDNGTNMKMASQQSNMCEYFCCIHTMQLAIHDTFKSVKGMQDVVNACKNLASYAHKSTTAEKLLIEKCQELTVKYKKIK